MMRYLCSKKYHLLCLLVLPVEETNKRSCKNRRMEDHLIEPILKISPIGSVDPTGNMSTYQQIAA